MEILCQERLDEAVKYAEKTNDQSLQYCLDRLKSWENNPRCKSKITLYSDSSPYSFGFRETYEDGRRGIVGGLLYHGSPDRSLAVLLEPRIGWAIHT